MVRGKIYVRVIKPVLDGVGAIILLIAFTPILILVGLILSMHFKGSPLFVQERIGKGDQIFRLIKFRTLTIDGVEDSATSLGKFLRSTSIDELPQLINVLKGEMSFVGPRPLLVEYLSYYNEEERKRHLVKPGITGWAQVNGRNSIDWGMRMDRDIEYVKRVSFALDMKILFLTCLQLLKRDKTAYMNKKTEKFSEYASKR